MHKKRIKALLVDDETKARMSLEKLLTRFCPEVDIAGKAANVDEAIQQVYLHQPDVIFLDIEMPEKSGFTLIHAFEKVNFHVVFVTAYDYYAVKAFEVSAVDYLLKPVDVERLKEATQKVVAQQHRQEYSNRFEAVESNIQGKELKKLAIPYKDDYAIVNIDNILNIEAARMYSIISVSDTPKQTIKHYTYSKELKYFEVLFEQVPNFIRVHRSWMINTRYITSYSKKDLHITLNNRIQIPLGRSYKTTFENLFGF